MGLAEPRKRFKFSRDPNNTQWTSSSNSFGRKILDRQGWTPGSGLGARNAKHTPTSTSSIKITYKDDNLGLGARVGAQEKDRSSDAFSGLLGRLNGKGEQELVQEERMRGQKKVERYVMGKWGGVLFVRGGLLVREEDFKAVKDAKTKSSILAEAEHISSEETRRANKKALERWEKREKQEKRQKKEDQRRRNEGLSAVTEGRTNTSVGRSEDDISARDAREAKRARKEERRKRKTVQEQAEITETSEATDPPELETVVDVPSAVKGTDEIVAFPPSKHGKRKRREQKEASPSRTPDVPQRAPAQERKAQSSSTIEHVIQSTAPDSEPLVSQSTPAKIQAAPMGRHVIRGRHIAQKKAAFLDDSSLKGIFTIKA